MIFFEWLLWTVYLVPLVIIAIFFLILVKYSAKKEIERRENKNVC